MMKKESFILVHAGEAPAPEIIQLEPEHLLDGMYQAIHCDCIEIVRVQTGLLLPHGVVLVADESGWFRKQLIINWLLSGMVMSWSVTSCWPPKATATASLIWSVSMTSS